MPPGSPGGTAAPSPCAPQAAPGPNAPAAAASPRSSGGARVQGMPPQGRLGPAARGQATHPLAQPGGVPRMPVRAGALSGHACGLARQAGPLGSHAHSQAGGCNAARAQTPAAPCRCPRCPGGRAVGRRLACGYRPQHRPLAPAAGARRCGRPPPKRQTPPPKGRTRLPKAPAAKTAVFAGPCSGFAIFFDMPGRPLACRAAA